MTHTNLPPFLPAEDAADDLEASPGDALSSLHSCPDRRPVAYLQPAPPAAAVPGRVETTCEAGSLPSKNFAAAGVKPPLALRPSLQVELVPGGEVGTKEEREREWVVLDGWMDGWTDIHTDRHTGRQTDRQTDR